MAFGAGINTICQEHARPKGRYQDVAVKCWFTASGRAMPLMLKVKSEQGEIIQIENIRILTVEKQRYTGILTWKYRCRIILNEKECEIILLFRPDECSWKMVV